MKIDEQFHSTGYMLIEDPISPDIAAMMHYFNKIINLNLEKDWRKEDAEIIVPEKGKSPPATIKYAWAPIEALLLYFKPFYQNWSGKELVPSYSFTRKYYRGNHLGRHSDRPSCQYSMTINIGSSDDSKPWHFFCEPKATGVQSQISQPLYQPIIYKGEEVDHWRDTLKKEYSTHVFLHYVDRHDPAYKEFWYDKRRFVG